MPRGPAPALRYDPHLKKLAADLRRRSTLAEVLLWQRLKGGQRMGHDFHRQKPILHWIADFFSPALKLVIEIDGDSHRFRTDADRAKEEAFADLGISTLRFGDSQVKENPGAVAAAIDAWIAAKHGRNTPRP